MTVRPVVPRLLVTEPTLKSVFAGIGSVMTKLAAAEPPALVNVMT